MNLKDAIRFIIDAAGDIYGTAESESIAFIVLDFIGFHRKSVLFNPEVVISLENEEFIRKVVKELKSNRPIQYILGETEFYGLKFRVDENVLIPRQETEELVERIIRENTKSNPVILDLGTGSGCIAVSLAKNIPSSVVIATDLYDSALDIANLNVRLNEVVVTTLIDNMLNSRLDKNLKFDIIVSNPPYVREQEKKLMHPNVLNYEPSAALFVKDDNPLIYYSAIADLAFDKLVSGGSLYVEINELFGTEVALLFKTKGLINPEIISDIHDKDRFIKAARTQIAQ